VRVSGETVANGFAIEVEDRGLGMSPTRLAELNDRLASPPEFNPSDSEQLGLFVVSQLAKRHGIRVTLKASPYGGTAAIVLIPRHLVVTEEAFRAGLPGEPAMAQLTANGNHSVPSTPSPPAATPPELGGQGSGSGFGELDGTPGPGQTPGVRISGPLRRSQGSIPERPERGAHAASAPALGAANGAAGNGSDDLPRRHGQPGTAANGGAMPFGAGPSSFDVFVPRRPPQDPGKTSGPADAGPGTPPPGSGPYMASPPYPAGGPPPFPGAAPAAPFPGGAPYPDQPAPFPGWTTHNPPGAPGGRAAPGPGGPATPMNPMNPVAPSRPGQASGPPWEISRETGPLPATPGSAGPGAPGPAGADPGGPGGNGDIQGLPRRVRQASLAPQLRDNPPPRRTTLASSGPSGGRPGTAGPPGSPAPGGPSPAEIRQTMSALQRGWQEGRSRRQAEQAAGEPPGGGPGSPAGAGPGAAPVDDPTTNEEARGGSDGS